MAHFSGAVKLADLDDFLGPSQSCVKPLMTAQDAPEDAPVKENKGTTIKIELEDVPTFSQIKTDAVTKVASVSLNDCLACSGCVTSAETVLITLQSTAELRSNLEDKSKVGVVTISPQSRAALAHDFGLTELAMLKKLTTFFATIGVNHVLDASCAQDLALLEQREEFVQRYREKRSLPVLASECPGWVCYAEKTQGEAVLPYISTGKSPQQIMGTLVKKRLSKELGVSAENIYHASVMPCYDKKLEGSRDDFYDSVLKTRDVDCVLTTGEVKQLLLDEKVDVVALQESKLHRYTKADADQNTLYRVTDTGVSGGYLENIFRYASKQLFGVDVDPGPLKFKVGRNPDLREAALEVEGKKVLRFAIAYGFRNIQNLMRKIKRNKCPYDYVEIMACPSGCLNGGGQIKADSIAEQKALVQALDGSYHKLPVQTIEETPLVKAVYDELVGGAPYSKQARGLFHTQYHAVESKDLSNPLGIKW